MDNSDLAYERHLKQREAYRRKVGIWLGACVGLSFGLVSQLINLIALPGLTIHQPPFGPLGNIILFTALGLMLGGVCGWLTGSAEGVLLASALGTLLLIIAIILSGRNLALLGTRMIAGLSLFLPIAGALVPVLSLLRWVINQQEEDKRLQVFSLQRMWRPVLLVGVAIGVGALWLLPPHGQKILQQMDALIQTARQSSTLPDSLKPPDVTDFMPNALGTYSLEWERYDVSRFGIGYYPKTGWDATASISRFENGWSLVCIYTNPEFPPSCKGYGAEK